MATPCPKVIGWGWGQRPTGTSAPNQRSLCSESSEATLEPGGGAGGPVPGVSRPSSLGRPEEAARPRASWEPRKATGPGHRPQAGRVIPSTHRTRRLSVAPSRSRPLA